MSRRIRVLHMMDNLNYGGMERVVADIVRRTDRSRFETHVMALTYLGRFADGLEEFATLHVARPMSRSSMLRPYRLAQDIRAIAPDVVHLHSGVWYKASLAARMARVPLVIYTDHGRQNPEPWINRAIDRRASARTNIVVAVSEKLRDDMARFVVAPEELRVIPNGVDTDRYVHRAGDCALRREIGITDDTPIIGSVGRLEPVKGYAVMLEAFARLRARWSGSEPPVLVLIGDGSERRTLEAQAVALGVRDSIHFLGWRDDIEDRVHAFTVFTMSSHSEGTSVSLLEAMSAGLCPVVTRVGGNPAVLGPDLQHRLVPPANPDALAAAWMDALRDGARRDADAATARNRIVERFSLDSMIRGYESLYALGAPRPRAG
jgi:glycosyltransferase involved in cell wall biosynthesis